MAGLSRPGWGSSCLWRQELLPARADAMRAAARARPSCLAPSSVEQQQTVMLAKQYKFIWRVPVSKFLTLHNKAHSHIAPQS